LKKFTHQVWAKLLTSWETVHIAKLGSYSRKLPSDAGQQRIWFDRYTWKRELPTMRLAKWWEKKWIDPTSRILYKCKVIELTIIRRREEGTMTAQFKYLSSSWNENTEKWSK
jgi:hypothetical protein